MEVPERLALIGGSILLSSTLIFTLKSQASSIIPHVSQSIGDIYNHIDDTQKDIFNNHFQQAQRNGWTTGTWGTAQYYIDGQGNIYIGSGNLDDTLYNHLGSTTADQLKSINFTGSVHAPNNSCGLLAALPHVTNINGLHEMNIGDVRDMTWMFTGDSSLESLDLGNWPINRNTHIWDAFNGDLNLHSIDITNFHDAFLMGNMFGNTNIQQMKVGPDTNLWGGQGVQEHNQWRAPDGFIGDFPGGTHPGIWTRQ